MERRRKAQWVYPEFAGFHGRLYWAALQTTELPVTVVTPTTNLFFRVLTPPTTDNANPVYYVNPPFPFGHDFVAAPHQRHRRQV